MAQTLKFGNGTWATKKDSILAYNDQNENYKPLPFNYTGAGKGTRVNKEGLIEVVENDRPRIDYTDSEEGVFLLEKASTNLVTYSEAFDNAYWTKTGASVVSDSAISPNGGLNAFKLIEDSSNSRHQIGSTVVTTSGYVSASVFSKYLSRYLRLTIHNSTNPNEWYCVIYDLQNGNIYDSLAKTVSVFDSKIEQMTNGYYRCVISADLGTNSTTLFYIETSNGEAILSSDDRGRGVYQGDGTSGVYLYGAQLESGNVSSYIPTQGSAQTRVAETASGSGNSEVFNDSEGVLFADISAFAGAGGGTRRIEVSNGINASQYVRLQIANGDGSLYSIVNNGTEQFLFNDTSFNPTLSNKIVLKYKQNDFSLFVNGFKVGSSNVGNTFADGVLTQANFSSTASEFYGKTKELAYYDEVLTDLESETLTSYRTWESMVKELNLNVIYNG